MPRVVFTANLKRHTDCAEKTVSGKTVLEALRQVFQENPKLKSYVLDEQDRLRKHMVIFVDGQTIQDRETLSDDVRNDSEIYVMQALSGG